MYIGGVDLDDALVSDLVTCGRTGHRIAQAHHNDPGSNGFTFGTDRYQRGTELSADVLPLYGFRTFRRGAGLVGRRVDVELQFAVAKGSDLTKPASFDADSSPARRQAGWVNAAQLQLPFPGLAVEGAVPVLHVVWSGDLDAGLTAVHIGQLFLGSDVRLDWAVLERIDIDDRFGARQNNDPGLAVTPSRRYMEQPEPLLVVEPRLPAAESDES